ncbi:MAG: TMEM165/GDT1 family protein [Dehalococcoidia bacterium]
MDLSNVLTAFGLLLVTEAGDKTQLAVIGLSARTRRGWAVFAGATLALIILTLAAAFIGSLLGGTGLGPWVVVISGALFIGIGLFALVSALRRPEELEEGAESVAETIRQSWLRVAATTFGVILLAEMGDKSQLAVAGLAADSQAPVSTFIGAGLALAFLSLLAVLAGATLSRFLKPRLIGIISGAAFIIVGIILLLSAL